SQGTGTLGVGNNAVAQNLVIGNTTGATGIQERVGTGNYSLDGVTNSTYTIGASTTTGTIDLGGASQSGTITLGKSAGASSTINIGAAAGNTFTQTINIGTSATAGSTTNLVVGSTVAGSTTLQSAGGVIVSTLGAASNDTYLCRNGSNQLATCNTTGAS